MKISYKLPCILFLFSATVFGVIATSTPPIKDQTTHIKKIKVSASLNKLFKNHPSQVNRQSKGHRPFNTFENGAIAGPYKFLNQNHPLHERISFHLKTRTPIIQDSFAHSKNTPTPIDISEIEDILYQGNFIENIREQIFLIEELEAKDKTLAQEYTLWQIEELLNQREQIDGLTHLKRSQIHMEYLLSSYLNQIKSDENIDDQVSKKIHIATLMANSSQYHDQYQLFFK